MVFSGSHKLQILYVVLFLVTYLLALTSNLLLITVIILDHHLHSPMYYFLKHLSLLDLCSSLSLFHSPFQTPYWTMAIPFFKWPSSQWCFKTGMLPSVGCCSTIMDSGSCRCAVMVVCVSGGLSGLMQTAFNFWNPHCEEGIIHQFFCDVPQMLKLACSYAFIKEIAGSTSTSYTAFVCLICIAFSYVQIFSVVLRMPSTDDQTKIFSISLCHLFIITPFPLCCRLCLRSLSDSPSAVNLTFSILYTVIPPALNLVIYSLRNKAMKAALKKVLSREGFSQRMTYLKVMFIL
uniref:G-protein coupled receptors family 1 profile domain-containing protein n=1 Tax=Nannospalax galili TaxID=1026970 RepID=A0A8C6QU12_NANGA